MLVSGTNFLNSCVVYYKYMRFDFVELFSKVVIINVLFLFSGSFLYHMTIITDETSPMLIIPIALHSVVMFLYPASILFKRSREKSYSFLKSRWHYAAISLTILYWVANLIKLSAL